MFDSMHTTRGACARALSLCVCACPCRDHAFEIALNADTPTRAAFHCLRDFAGVQHDEIREMESEILDASATLTQRYTNADKGPCRFVARPVTQQCVFMDTMSMAGSHVQPCWTQ